MAKKKKSKKPIVQNDFTGLQHVTTTGDLQGHVRVLLNQENGGAGLVDLFNRREDSFHQNWCQAHRWLVHQQK